jgi:ACDE family multidrug resistance protein
VGESDGLAPAPVYGEPSAAPDRWLLWILVTAAAVEGVSGWLVSPILPVVGRNLHLGPAGIGIISSAAGAAQLPAYLLAGRSIGRFGARRALLIGMVCSVAADGLYLAGGGAALYFLARLLQGTEAAWIWMGIIFCIIERRGRHAGRELPAVFAGYSAGHVIGPLVGGIGGVRIPFLVHLVLVVPVMVAVVRIPRRAPAPAAPLFSVAMLRDPTFRYAMLGWSIVGLCLGFFQGGLAVHFAERLAQAQVGWLYTLTAVAAAIGAFSVGRLAHTTFRRRGVALAAVLYAAGMFAAGASHSLGVWILAAVVIGLGSGGIEPNLVAYVAHTAAPALLVAIQTVTVEGFAVGLFVGPALGGLIAEHSGFGVASATIAVPAIVLAMISMLAPRERPHVEAIPQLSP